MPKKTIDIAADAISNLHKERDDLQRGVDTLQAENAVLREEILKLHEAKKPQPQGDGFWVPVGPPLTDEELKGHLNRNINMELRSSDERIAYRRIFNGIQTLSFEERTISTGTVGRNVDVLRWLLQKAIDLA